jgi:glycosyltransferase involved in cell wall biosynthesis
VNAHSLPLQGKLIAFFHQSSDMYGSDKILLYLAEGVNKLGGQAVVMLPDTGPLTQELEQRGIEFHALPMLKVTRARFSFKGVLELAREMRVALPAYDRVLRGRKVDLVHSNTIAVLGGALWASRRRIPHLWHVHEIIEHPWLASHIFPLLLKLFADRVVCNSKATYQWLFSMQPSLKRKMCVIWNGVQAPTRIEESSTEQLHRKFRPGGSRLAVGLVGRINRWKGHGLLLDAVDILHRKGVKDFSVVFMGNSPPGQENFELELRQRISKSPVQDHIIVQGFSSNVWPTYAALDIVCVPSTEPEPFGLVAVEAMAMGKPVVAARFGGLTEIVVDGATGLTFSPCDANALATALESLLCDDAMRTRLGCAGRERFDKEFSAENMWTQFTRLFRSMIYHDL